MANQRAKDISVEERQEAAREYVTSVLEQRGWKPTELARQIGVVPSTINRFLSDGRVSHALSVDNLLKIQELSGIPLSARVSVAYNLPSSAPAPMQQLSEPPNARYGPEVIPHIEAV